MRGSADTARMPNVRSCRAFFRFEIAWQDQPPEMTIESTSDFSHSEMCAASRPISRHEVRAHFFSGASQLFFCGRVSLPQF